jgi:serine/threonine protein kinase
MIGEKILGYTVDEKIGTGGFGTVYKVSKTNVSGTYIRALKHISIPSQKQYLDVLNSMGGDYSKADDYFSDILKEIVNEIQILSSLSESGTKNIVRYYENDIVESNSPKKYDIYILMEYLTPFTEYMYKNELKVSDVLKLGKDILKALISCHENNVIHRDIKDDNIFISNDGEYKLADFGVSKMISDRSRAESMKGTPNFIAPEVYLGNGKYDETVDIYSLGIVLYRLLNKSRNPFLPDFPSTYNSSDEDLAFEKRMKGEKPELPYDAQNSLGEVVLKAISNRESRYNSAKEFLADLISAEKKLAPMDLDKVVNQIMVSAVDKTNIEKSEMQETIGIMPNNYVSEKRYEKEMFATVNDRYSNTSYGQQAQISNEAGINSSNKKNGNKIIMMISGIAICVVTVIICIILFVNKDSKSVLNSTNEEIAPSITQFQTATEVKNTSVTLTETSTVVSTETPTVVSTETPTVVSTETPTAAQAESVVDQRILNAIEYFSPTELNTYTLTVGGTHKPSASVWLNNGSQGTVYSSDPNIASVNAGGVVTGISAGQAYVVIMGFTGMTQCYLYIVR